MTTAGAIDREWDRYPETIVEFPGRPPFLIDLREPITSTQRVALHECGLGEAFAIITAADPMGRDLTSSENAARNAALRAELERAGWRVTPVLARSPDGRHREPSFAVVLPRRAGVRVARAYGQVALFWFDRRRFWIVGAAVRFTARRLPR